MNRHDERVPTTTDLPCWHSSLLEVHTLSLGLNDSKQMAQFLTEISPSSSSSVLLSVEVSSLSVSTWLSWLGAFYFCGKKQYERTHQLPFKTSAVLTYKKHCNWSYLSIQDCWNVSISHGCKASQQVTLLLGCCFSSTAHAIACGAPGCLLCSITSCISVVLFLHSASSSNSGILGCQLALCSNPSLFFFTVG